MKTILFVLMPILILAQNQLPDTLFLVDGRSVPSIISYLENSKVYFIYSGGRNESIIMEAIDKIYLEDLGIVYTAKDKFIAEEDYIQSTIEKRYEKLLLQKRIDDEITKLSEVSAPGVDIQISDTEHPLPETSFSRKLSNRWAFGVLYVPYYSGQVYEVIRSNHSFQPQISTFGYVINEISLEAQLAYAITQNIWATFETNYTSSYQDSRYENHYRSQHYSSDNGSIRTVGLKMFDFSLGLKYYFNNVIIERVNIYALCGFGKQLAFAQNKYEQLFNVQDPRPIVEDNIEGFTEDLNSPWHFNFGFGAEYYFNKSFSVTSNIKFLYSSSSGKYDLRYFLGSETQTSVEEQKFSDFKTRIGIGLNFYF